MRPTTGNGSGTSPAQLQYVPFGSNYEFGIAFKPSISPWWTQRNSYEGGRQPNNTRYRPNNTRYRAFFSGQCRIPGAKELSKTKATPCCKFFWLALIQRRCWISNHFAMTQPAALRTQSFQAPGKIEHLCLSGVYRL